MGTASGKPAARYLVRSDGGELAYETLLHLEQAYLAGLVAPDDEIAIEGSGQWKKARELPQLANLKKHEKTLAGAYVPWIVSACVLALAALFFLFRGRDYDWLVALVLTIILSAVLFRLTYKTARPKR